MRPGTVAAVTPAPPWSLHGECVMAFSAFRPPDPLPPGIRAVPGPCAMVAARYTASSVGPYLEAALLLPARLGPLPGVHVAVMTVDSSASCEGGRRNWGFPKEMGELGWDGGAGRPSLRWEERGLRVEGRPMGPAAPLALPLCCLQRRGDEPVSVLGWLRGRARRAEVAVHLPAGDPLEPWSGTHRGLVVSDLRMRMGPARRTRAGP